MFLHRQVGCRRRAVTIVSATEQSIERRRTRRAPASATSRLRSPASQPAAASRRRYGLRDSPKIAIRVPSQHTKNSILGILKDVDPGKIEVVAYGVSEDFRPRSAAERRQVIERIGLPTPYILFVGTIEPRKISYASSRRTPDSRHQMM
jgi:hypothetical protein